MKIYSFYVEKKFPKKPPHDHGRWGRPFVPDDVKAWRAAIVKAAKKAGFKGPEEGEIIDIIYSYRTANKKRADLDSLTHAAQDALSKDFAKQDDKHWNGRYCGSVEDRFTKDRIEIHATVCSLAEWLELWKESSGEEKN